MSGLGPAPALDDLFGKYELVSRIATGGMAEIFRAVSSSIGGFQKVVALKRILPHLSTDAEFVSLFIAEAKLAVSLTHSNIVQVLDFGRVDQNHYIAMEFVEGKDLTQILIKQSRARKLVPIEAAVYMLAETARALEYAHARRERDGTLMGIVHRDVSPHNILVSYDGEVKLTDFGIAKAKNHVTLSKPGVILGKFAYMSPEQARGDQVDARTDIYAAGITLYETLTGRRLFYSDDPLVTLAKVRAPKVPLPSRYNPLVTPELDALVMRALAPEPRDRFQTARDLSTALTGFLVRMRPDFTDFDIAQFMRDAFGDEVEASKFSLAARGASVAVEPAATLPVAPARDSAAPGPRAPDLRALDPRLPDPRAPDPRLPASVPDRMRALGHPSGSVPVPGSVPVLLDAPKHPLARADDESALRVALGSAPSPSRGALDAPPLSITPRYEIAASRLDTAAPDRGSASGISLAGIPRPALDEDSATHDAAPLLATRPQTPAKLVLPDERAPTPVIPRQVLLRALEEARESGDRGERGQTTTDDPRLRRALERLANAPDSDDPLEAETFTPGRLTPPPLAALAADGDPVLESLTARLMQEPNLWLLAELGQRLVHLGRGEEGILALRVAALKFAQNGLLVQALALYVELIEVTHRAPQTFREISALGPLAGRPSAAVLELIGPLPSGALGRLLGGLVLGSEPSRVAQMLSAPLFSFLGPEELARFASMLRLRRVPPATSIVEEGQRGQSLYVIARGRAIIYCKNYQGERVYLSSLTDGDCFGEFSFFTGEPRAATVETADYVTLFEIAQQDFDRVIDEFPGLTRALLRLYKERVIATLLAKSEVFGVLSPRARGSLLDRFEARKWDHGQLIIEEGARDGAFYLLKSGEVEVFSQKNGYVLLSKLKAGDFFGEIAALTGLPRSASVRALCPVEALELSAEHLKSLLEAHPDMARVLERRIKQREAERALRVTAGGVLI